MQIITYGDNSRAVPNHTVWETQEKYFFKSAGGG